MSAVSRRWGKGHTTGSRVVVTNSKGEFLRVENPHAQLGGKRLIRYKSNETLMFQALSIIFPGERYIDHYRPAWLVNPRTGRTLELDRYYPDLKLAFEYNGRHHDDRQQQLRDGIKAEACQRERVALVIVDSTHAISAKDIIAKVNTARLAAQPDLS